MGFSTQGLLCLFVVVFSTVTRCNAQCTEAEVNAMFSCITPHNQEFFDAFQGSGSACNRSVITETLCQKFSAIVVCINTMNVSRENCLPNAPSQLNPGIGIPCKVEDFIATCTEAPSLGDTSSTTTTSTTTTTTSGDDSNSSSSTYRDIGLSFPLVMLSLAAVFGF